MRPLLLGLLTLALAPGLPRAQAQTSPVVVLDYGTVPHLGPIAEAARGDSVEADTTSPWRYYPLHVGNAWEYDVGGGYVFRRDIIGETVIEGQRYVLWRAWRFQNGEIVMAIPPIPIRYDTLTSFVLERWGDGEVTEFGSAPCPLNAAFGSVADCDLEQAGNVLYDVTGSYDVAVVFSETSDTLRTSVKRYENQGVLYHPTYAAGLGEIILESELYTYSLFYARIDGVEYGEQRTPVGTEPGALVEEVVVSTWPNPFHRQITLAVELPRPQAVTAEVFDLMGRRVLIRDLGVQGAGFHTAVLDAAHLASGSYVLRIRGSGGVLATRLLSKVGS